MFSPFDLVKASLQASWAAFRPPHLSTSQAGETHEASVIIPIRSLGANQRPRIEAHLLSLDAQDRYLRFGYAVQDEQIRLYVAGLDFDRDEIFGIFDRKLSLLAVAHLAYGPQNETNACAEFGVSVREKARGRGYGRRLFDRAAMDAGNQGVKSMFVHALSENAAMLHMARTAGAIVKREGAESEAYLQLPQPSIHSRMSEMLEQHVADADYQIKLQAKQFWRMISTLQTANRSADGVQKSDRH